MFGNKKVESGSDVIAGAMSGFELIVSDLEKGINLCNEECQAIDSEMVELQDRKKAVLESKTRAAGAAAKIRALIA